MLKTVDVTVAAEGRDRGKVFRITEMAADRAEEWGWRAAGVLARSGADIPPMGLWSNLQVVAAFGLQAVLLADFTEAKPLLEELIACVECVPDPSMPSLVRPLVASDTMEFATRLWLRDEVLKLHTGFSVAAVLSNFKKLAQEAAAMSGSPAPSPIPLSLSE